MSMHVKIICWNCKKVVIDWEKTQVVTINLTSYGKNLQDEPCPRCGGYMWYLEVKEDPLVSLAVGEG